MRRRSTLESVSTKLENDKREAYVAFMNDVWLVARIVYRRFDRECLTVGTILEQALHSQARGAWHHLYEHVARMLAALDLRTGCGTLVEPHEEDAARRLHRFLEENRDLANAA